MAWQIEFTRNADKAMRKLDKGVAARVFNELDEIAKLEDPRSRGKALTGNLAGVWRYRVGDVSASAWNSQVPKSSRVNAAMRDYGAAWSALAQI